MSDATAKRNWSVRLILALLSAVILMVTIFQNTEVIALRFFFWELEVSQIVVVGLAGLLGLLIGFSPVVFTGAALRRAARGRAGNLGVFVAAS